MAIGTSKPKPWEGTNVIQSQTSRNREISRRKTSRQNVERTDTEKTFPEQSKCDRQSYRGLNVFTQDMESFSKYFVTDGRNDLLTSDTAEDGEIAQLAAKQWIRDYHASEDEDD